MAGDNFDFTTAASLVQALREGFKDSGYDAFALDMTAANNSIKEVITQMHVVANHIAKYAEKLKHV